MNPGFLAAFFAAAIVGCAVAFVRIDPATADYGRWVFFFLIYVLYRSKIMIDDLGWYADLKRAKTDAHPLEVIFVTLAWVSWLLMAAAMGESFRYFSGLFVLTFVISSVYVYATDYIAQGLGDDQASGRLSRILLLKSKRHVRWLLINLALIVGGVLCFLDRGPLFAIGALVIAVTFVIDVLTNTRDFRRALIDAGRF